MLVQGLKYRGSLACARPLATALANVLDDEPYPDLVIPMPLARTRTIERGFNQAMEIARYLSIEFGIKASNAVCRRTRDTVPQISLPWKQRARNMRGAFECSVNLSGKRVAVVDDVLTTGATLNELAAVLKRQGAVEVVGWVATRTPAPGDA